jgi:hypothetical protein
MNIYADVTDEGLQPFYTYTLAEIIEQYEYDGNRMPIDKVYVQYDEDEYYLEDPAEVEADDQLLTEDEIKAVIAEADARERWEEAQREQEEEFKKLHPIRAAVRDAFWPTIEYIFWAVLVWIPLGLGFLVAALYVYNIVAGIFGWTILFDLRI